MKTKSVRIFLWIMSSKLKFQYFYIVVKSQLYNEDKLKLKSWIVISGQCIFIINARFLANCHMYLCNLLNIIFVNNVWHFCTFKMVCFVFHTVTVLPFKFCWKASKRLFNIQFSCDNIPHTVLYIFGQLKECSIALCSQSYNVYD